MPSTRYDPLTKPPMLGTARAADMHVVMVPDLMPDTPEMQQLYTCKCDNLNQVLDKLKAGDL